MRRLVLVTTTLMMVFTLVGTTGASAYARKIITCTGLHGTLSAVGMSGNGNLSGCTGNTGGSGTFTSDDAFSNVTITWANSRRTSFTLSNKRLNKPKGCMVSGPMSGEEKGTGVVTGDNTGSIKLGANAKAKWCFDGFVDGASISMPTGGTLKL